MLLARPSTYFVSLGHSGDSSRTWLANTGQDSLVRAILDDEHGVNGKTHDRYGFLSGHTTIHRIGDTVDAGDRLPTHLAHPHQDQRAVLIHARGPALQRSR